MPDARIRKLEPTGAVNEQIYACTAFWAVPAERPFAAK